MTVAGEDGRSLDGRRVVVVGGTRGIGLATARAAADRGALVVLGGRTRPRVDQVVREIGGHARGGIVDATDAAAVRRFLASAAPIDHVVVTATGAALGRLVDADLDSLLALFDTKFWGGVRVVKEALGGKYFAENASIVLFSGASAHKGSPGFAVGAALNAAVESLVRSLAAELAPIRVNAVSPGLVDTPVWDALPGITREQVLRGAGALPVPRLGLPAELAEVVMLLLENCFMTGAVIAADGGFSST